MKVIYATSELDEWIELAKEMQEKKGWQPIYWVTTPKNEKFIQKSFPNTHCQNFISATRGEYVPLNESKEIIPLDSNILLQYSHYEKIALKMMDRMDATAYSFNYSERLQLYHDFLTYWINAISVLEADYVVFSESPHALFQYILYAVCKENRVKVLRFTPTHIEGLTFLSYGIGGSPNYLKEMIASNPKTTPFAEAYLAKSRGEYSKALPYYMKDINQKSSVLETVKNIGGKLQRFLFSQTVSTAYKKSANVALSDAKITKYNLLLYKLKGVLFKKKLKKSYDYLTVEANLTKPYIYVALHYQPEKTTSPEGDIFVEQWLMVQMLAHLVPDGWMVYVKEHNSQFAERLYGEQGRTHDFYQRLSEFENVKLIASQTSSFDLIDNAQAAATVTGTVGLESAIRSVPVLSFGHAWYTSCEGVFDVKNSDDVRAVLQKIENGYIVNRDAVDSFLYAIEKVSFPCYLNPGNSVGVSFGEKENLKNLVTCLITYAKGA